MACMPDLNSAGTSGTVAPSRKCGRRSQQRGYCRIGKRVAAHELERWFPVSDSPIAQSNIGDPGGIRRCDGDQVFRHNRSHAQKKSYADTVESSELKRSNVLLCGCKKSVNVLCRSYSDGDRPERAMMGHHGHSPIRVFRRKGLAQTPVTLSPGSQADALRLGSRRPVLSMRDNTGR